MGRPKFSEGSFTKKEEEIVYVLSYFKVWNPDMELFVKLNYNELKY